MTIEEKEIEIQEEFGLFGDDWESKYEHLIGMGRTLPMIDPELKTDDRLIKGCQSRVWLNSEFLQGKMRYSADSDAIITRGLVGLLVRVLSDQKPEDIVNAKLGFIAKIGLKEHLSPTRANGLVSMIEKMKFEASQYLKERR